MDEHVYRLLEIAGAWLSGVGSLLAVIVALYLARKQGAVLLKINVGYRMVITRGSDDHTEVVAISVSNLGARPVVITNVLWITGIIKRQHAVQLTGSVMDSLRIHQALDPGHQGSFYIEIDPTDADNWMRRMAKDMPYRFRTLWTRRMKVGISTAVGTTVWEPIEKSLQEKLLEVAEALDRLPPAANSAQNAA